MQDIYPDAGTLAKGSGNILSSSPTFLFIWWLINDARLQYVSHWRQKATAVLIIPCHGDDTALGPQISTRYNMNMFRPPFRPCYATWLLMLAQLVLIHYSDHQPKNGSARAACTITKPKLGAYLKGGRRRSVQHRYYLHSSPSLYELHVESDQLRPIRLNFKHSDSVYRRDGCSSRSRTS